MTTFPGTRRGNVRLTGPADVYYFYLSPESRQAVDAVLDDLARWHTADYIRDHGRLLKADENIYTYSADEQNRVFVVRVGDDEIEVVAIFEQESLMKFLAGMEQTAE